MGGKSNAALVNVVTIGVIVLLLLFWFCSREGSPVVDPEPTPTPLANGVERSFTYSPTSLTIFKTSVSTDLTINIKLVDGNFSLQYYRIKFQDNYNVLGFVEYYGFYGPYHRNIFEEYPILNTFPLTWEGDETVGAFSFGQVLNNAHLNCSSTAQAGTYTVYMIFQFSLREGESTFLSEYPSARSVWTYYDATWGTQIFYEAKFPVNVTVVG